MNLLIPAHLIGRQGQGLSLIHILIVGSAIVKLCKQYGEDCIPYVKEYVREMKEAVKEAD